MEDRRLEAGSDELSSCTRQETGLHAIIFGGAGFVGTHLGRRLISEGWTVLTADVRAPASEVDGVEYRLVDVREPIRISRPQDQTVIFNLAAIHRTPGHPADAYYDTNVRGALNVTRWADDNDVSDLVFTSSISVYGPSEQLKTETCPLAPNSSYGHSKLLAEQIHADWVSRGSNRTLAVFRPAVIFGVGEQGNFTRLARALRSRCFVIPGRADTVKACGYVGDLTSVLVKGPELAKGSGGLLVSNFSYPKSYTILEICQAFHEVAGYPLPRVAPAALIDGGRNILRFAPGVSRRLEARIAKLVVSTNVSVDLLRNTGFQWGTDLVSGLKLWADDSGGRFV